MNRIRHESRQYGHGRARRQAAKFILIISFSTLALKFSTHIAPRPGRGRTWDRRDPFKLCTTRPGPSKFKKEKLVILQRGQDGGGATDSNAFCTTTSYHPCFFFYVLLLLLLPFRNVNGTGGPGCLVIRYDTMAWQTSPTKPIIVERRWYTQENHHSGVLSLPSYSSLTFTCELVSRAGDLHLDPPPPLGVLAAAEVRHRLLAFLVHVHITGWEGLKCIMS